MCILASWQTCVSWHPGRNVYPGKPVPSLGLSPLGEIISWNLGGNHILASWQSKVSWHSGETPYPGRKRSILAKEPILEECLSKAITRNSHFQDTFKIWIQIGSRQTRIYWKHIMAWKMYPGILAERSILVRQEYPDQDTNGQSVIRKFIFFIKSYVFIKQIFHFL